MAADDSGQGQPATTRRRRGRPPGSKTKTTRRRLGGSELIEQLNNLVAQLIKENRKLKRDVKRAGNKRRRQHLKRDLADNPEEAAFTEFEFGRDSSTGLNALDRDATRRRPEKPAEE